MNKTLLGGIRNIKEITNSKEIVYEEANGEKSMIVEEMVMPEIEGALIVAEGASNAQVKANASEAVSILTGLPINKICVLEMK